MATQTTISNLALARLGQTRITDINDDNASAEVIRDFWDTTRRAALRAHSWNFATKRAALTAGPTEPLWQWTKQYPLPSDFLRLLAVNNDSCIYTRGVLAGTRSQSMAIEGTNLLTNSTVAQIVYVRDETACELWDDLFVEAFTWKLAANIAGRLVPNGGDSTREMMNGEFDKKIEAMSVNNTEAPPRVKTATQGSEYVRARYAWDGGWGYPWWAEGIPEEFSVSPNPWNVSP